jgi:hypothetical protein
MHLLDIKVFGDSEKNTRESRLVLGRNEISFLEI